jgi:hypothetical protein
LENYLDFLLSQVGTLGGLGLIKQIMEDGMFEEKLNRAAAATLLCVFAEGKAKLILFHRFRGK